MGGVGQTPAPVTKRSARYSTQPVAKIASGAVFAPLGAHIPLRNAPGATPTDSGDAVVVDKAIESRHGVAGRGWERPHGGADPRTSDRQYPGFGR